MTQYTLLRSDRRTLCLSVDRQGDAIVRAPLKMPQAEIDAFVQKHTAWLEKQRARAAELPPPPDPARLDEMKKTTAERVAPMVEKYSALTGLVPTGVKITAAQHRWGSCSGKNGLCFSYMLADRPDAAVESVVLHELAHIRYKNHGPRFYALIEKYMPDYAQRKKLLKNR